MSQLIQTTWLEVNPGHGPDLEKHNHISSKTSTNQTLGEMHPPARVGAEQRALAVTQCQGWWHQPGDAPQASSVPWTTLLGSCFRLCSRCINFSISRCSIPLPLGVISIPIWSSPFLCFPVPHLSPFQKPGLDTLAWRKIQTPASCQLCLWPIALVSCLTLNSTVYTAESSGPKRMSQEPARNLSFS